MGFVARRNTEFIIAPSILQEVVLLKAEFRTKAFCAGNLRKNVRANLFGIDRIACFPATLASVVAAVSAARV